MDTKPKEITKKEWEEIIAIEAVREGWGLEKEDTAEEFSQRVFGARFDFVSGMPGYCGDVFVLYGDALAEPMTLYRKYPDKVLVVM